MHIKPKTKPITWIGSSLKDVREMPEDVRDVFGKALYMAQRGGKHESAKPLKGFGGAGVLEIVEDCSSDTYRAVYTVRFSEAVYVLHVFQKKSKKGITTPKEDLEKIKSRLKLAEEMHRREERRIT